MGAEPPVQGEDLERDVPAQRLLHRLVDDPHAAPADLAENPVFARAGPSADRCRSDARAAVAATLPVSPRRPA